MITTIDFRNIQPSMSENNSLALYIDLFTDHPTWRCYTETTTEEQELESIIDRYVRSHSSVPGVVTEEILSSEPMEVLRFIRKAIQITGLFYKNGSVIEVLDINNQTTKYILLIDDLVAQVWGYPDTYVYPSKYFEKKQ